jgi:hypothetical protein
MIASAINERLQRKLDYAKEFMKHYHIERFHQGLGGQLVKGQPGSANDNGSNGSMVRRSRLGGLMNCYQSEAASASATTFRTPRGQCTRVHASAATARTESATLTRVRDHIPLVACLAQ